MIQSLTIEKEILGKMAAVFSTSQQEQGFVLGCSARLDCVDTCEQIPAIRAGLHFYTPDASYANQVIQNWSEVGVCFCGFVHSHIVNKPALSEADIEYARSMFQVYRLPVLWFGIGLVQKQNVDYHLYSVTTQNDKVHISSVALKAGN